MHKTSTFILTTALLFKQTDRLHCKHAPYALRVNYCNTFSVSTAEQSAWSGCGKDWLMTHGHWESSNCGWFVSSMTTYPDLEMSLFQRECI